MPWVVERRGRRFAVVNPETGKVEKIHKRRRDAERHQRALYANVPEARQKSEELEMKLDHKDVEVKGLTVIDEAEGIVESYVSVTNVVDRVRDNILPGAYEKTLGIRTPKACASHDWSNPVGKTLEAKEIKPGDPSLPPKIREAGGGALRMKTQFNMETQRGREAFADVVFFGDEGEWSIGYRVPPGGARVDKKTGVREIHTIDLYEYSPVLFGAMPLARTVSVKADGDTDVVTLRWPDGSTREVSAEDLDAILGETVEPEPEPTPEGDEPEPEPEGDEPEPEPEGDEPEPEPEPEPGEEKSAELRGSYEDVIESLRAAISPKYEDSWVRIIGTYPDRVVYAVVPMEMGGDYTEQNYQAGWLTNPDGTLTVGEPQKVDVNTTVTVTATTTEGKVEEHELTELAPPEAKVGRAISAANRAKLRAAQKAIAELLAAAGSGDDDEKGDDDELETKAASGAAGLPLAARTATWDGSAADQRVASWASDADGNIDWAKYGQAFFWQDPDNVETKGGHKLGFADVVDGKLTAIPKGIFAVAAVLRGARGGVDVPAADLDGIRSKVAAYYARMAKEFDDATIRPPWSTKADDGEIEGGIDVLDEETFDDGEVEVAMITEADLMEIDLLRLRAQ